MGHHRQGNVNSRPKSFKKNNWERRGGGGEGAMGAVALYFTPGNFRQKRPLPLETPQNCVTPLANFERPRIKTPGNFT